MTGAPGSSPSSRASGDLVARRRLDDVLRDRVHVAPAAVEHSVERDRVHPRRVVQQIDGTRRELHRGDEHRPIARQRHVVERLACLTALPHLRDGVAQCRARRFVQSVRLTECGLRMRPLGEQSKVPTGRHLLDRERFERIEHVSRRAHRTRREAGPDLRPQGDHAPRTVVDGREREGLERPPFVDLDSVELVVTASRCAHTGDVPRVEATRPIHREEHGPDLNSLFGHERHAVAHHERRRHEPLRVLRAREIRRSSAETEPAVGLGRARGHRVQ